MPHAALPSTPVGWVVASLAGLFAGFAVMAVAEKMLP